MKKTSEEKWQEVKEYYEKSYPKIFSERLKMRKLSAIELESLYTSMKKLKHSLARHYSDLPFLGTRLHSVRQELRLIEKRNVND